jgi:hypothetical protein
MFPYSRCTLGAKLTCASVAHTGFLKPSRIKHVHVKRLPRKPLQEDTDPWEPYPTRRPPRPAYYHTYFEEACNLSEIASEISRTLFVTDKFLDDREQLSHTVDVLYRKLKLWHENLPEAFDPSHKPAPHILLLQYVPPSIWPTREGEELTQSTAYVTIPS